MSSQVEPDGGDGSRGFEIAKVIVGERGSVGYLLRPSPGGRAQFLLRMKDVEGADLTRDLGWIASPAEPGPPI
jgi:hypothetical protein